MTGNARLMYCAGCNKKRHAKNLSPLGLCSACERSGTPASGGHNMRGGYHRH